MKFISHESSFSHAARGRRWIMWKHEFLCWQKGVFQWRHGKEEKKNKWISAGMMFFFFWKDTEAAHSAPPPAPLHQAVFIPPGETRSESNLVTSLRPFNNLPTANAHLVHREGALPEVTLTVLSPYNVPSARKFIISNSLRVSSNFFFFRVDFVWDKTKRINSSFFHTPAWRNWCMKYLVLRKQSVDKFDPLRTTSVLCGWLTVSRTS